MAIAVTDLGTTANTSGSTLALTLSTAVPAGALIVVAVGYGANTTYSTSGSMTDDAGNTYTKAIGQGLGNNSFGVGAAELYYAFNVTALSSGQKITLTKKTGFTAGTDLTAFYATGIATTSPLDTSVTAIVTTTTTPTLSPTVTSGTPSQAGDLIVGVLWHQDSNGTSATYNQDTTHGFSTPFTHVTMTGQVQNLEIGGGNLVNAGAATTTFSPTLTSSSSKWYLIAVLGFKATTSTTYNQTVTVTCSSSVAFAKSATKTVSVTCSTVTAVTKAVAKTLAVACSSVVSVVKQASKALTVACSTAVSAVKQVSKTLATSVASSTAVIVSRAYIVTITVACNTAVSFGPKVISKQIVAACSSVTSTAKAVGKHIAVSAGTSVSLVKQVAHTVTVQCASVSAVTKRVSLTISLGCVSAVLVVVREIKGLLNRRRININLFRK